MSGLYSWVATDAKTGAVLADLPDLNLTDPIRQTIGRYESVGATLPIPSAPPDWQRATTAGAANMILLSQPTDSIGNYLGQPVPVWGATVAVDIVAENDVVQLALTTLEAYLDRRYVGNQTFTGVGQNDIINTLVNGYIKVGPNGGIPIRVQYVTGGAGTARDRTYADQDDKTIYSILTDLMAVQGGPEWYIGWEHQSAPERYTPVLYVGDRIGSAVPAGLGPAATFEMPGPVQSFQRTRDYSSGKGANSVIATSSGQGTTRPQSPPQLATDPMRPTYEYRWTPSTSITDTNTLVSWAQSAVAAMDSGAVTLTMSAVASDAGCPQLGIDWFIGDDIGFNIGGIDSNGNDTVPSVPGGLRGVARAVGYQLTLDNTPIITPVLAGPSIA